MSLFGKPVPAPAQSLIDAQISVNNLREARTTQADPVAVILKEFECEVTLREHEEAQRINQMQNMYALPESRYTRCDTRAMAAEILRLREALKQPVQDERPWQHGIGTLGREYRVWSAEEIEIKRFALWQRTGEIPVEDIELVAALIEKARRRKEKP